MNTPGSVACLGQQGQEGVGEALTTLALYGVYYRLTPLANNTRLAQAHAGIAIVGVVVMVTGIAIVRAGGPATLAAIGAMLSLLSAAIFLVTVIRHGFGVRV